MDKRLIAGYNEFGFRLLRDLSKSSGDNMVISPHSVATALAMLNNGARGQSQGEISRTLGINALSLTQLNDANAALHDELLLGNSPTTLNVANAVWTQQGASFEKVFLKNLQRSFDAETGQLDFTKPAAVDTINGWANEKTEGMIPEILKSLAPDTVMVLGNAVYFKGKWQKPFEKSKTEEADFHLAKSQKNRVSMMTQSGKYLYLSLNPEHDVYRSGVHVDLFLQAVALPYSDKRLSLYIFLPDEKQSLDLLIAQINNENWKSWMSQFSERQGSVTLPRFKTQYRTELIKPLRRLGIKQVFEQGKADLSGMSQRKDLFVSQAIHESVVDVNEEGTEAAAVTTIAAAGSAMSSEEPPPFKFVANRPFLFVLHDSKTDAILFLGAVRNPQ